jgi:hypothetical protein
MTSLPLNIYPRYFEPDQQGDDIRRRETQLRFWLVKTLLYPLRGARNLRLS